MIWLTDRLADGWQMAPFHIVSSSPYHPHTVTVRAMLADMADFFTYSVYITKKQTAVRISLTDHSNRSMKRVMQII